MVSVVKRPLYYNVLRYESSASGPTGGRSEVDLFNWCAGVEMTNWVYNGCVLWVLDLYHSLGGVF